MKGTKARKCEHCGEPFKTRVGKQIYCKRLQCKRDRRKRYWDAYIQKWKEKNPNYFSDYLRCWRRQHPSYWVEWKKKHPGYFKAWYRKRRLRALKDRLARQEANSDS